MNPIKSIELQSFQSHQSTVIEPAPPGKLTVITGPSDSGKTAIIRALKWLLYNQPQGADFMRTGASKVRVNVKFADRNIVTRERTAATNRYKILRPVAAGQANKPEVFEGFGAAVPLEIQEITGVRSVRIADQDLLLNLSEQLDPPFLGQKATTAPGRAKILGKLAGTEEIDVAGADVGKDLYRRGQEKKTLEAEIAGLGEQIEGFGWVDGLGERIEAAEAVLNEVRKRRERLERLRLLDGNLFATKEAIRFQQGFIKRWARLPEAERALSYIQQTVNMTRRIETLRGQLNGVGHQLGLNQKTLNRLHGLEAAEQAANLTGEKITRIKQLHGLNVRLGQVASNLNLCRAELKRPRIIHVKQIAAAVKSAEDAAVRAGELAILKGRLAAINDREPKLIKTATFYKQRILELEQEYLERLKRAKICPTCGQSVTGLNETKLKEVV